MEGFNHKEYRDNLAKKIHETDPDKRQGLLSGEKAFNAEYNLAWVQHQAEKHGLKKDEEEIHNIIQSSFVPKSHEFKSPYSGYLAHYVTAFNFLYRIKNDPNISKESLLHYEAWKLTFGESFEIFKEKLKDSTLVDLGCGGIHSLRNSYTFARLFECKKYIGVDKNFLSDGETLTATELEQEPLLLEPKTKSLRLISQDKALPKKEFVEREMLEFVSSRTERSNFMINGIDHYIKPYSKEYDAKLIEHIARLVPSGGIVFGVNSSFLYGLMNYGFEYKEVRHLGLSLYIKK